MEVFKTARRPLRKIGYTGGKTVEQRVDDVVVRIKAYREARGDLWWEGIGMKVVLEL
jgi:hypothetical protein